MTLASPHRGRSDAQETTALTMSDGATVLLRRTGNPEGPRLVLSHGNGFAIDGYRVFWQPLAADYDLMLFDFRNHGRNPPSNAAGHDWPAFVDDMETVRRAIETHYGAKPTAGVFHSLSAVTAIMHVLSRGWRWEHLVLIEPPVYTSVGHPLQATAQTETDFRATWSARRRERFASPDELARVFRHTRDLRRWRPPSYDDMARAILRPADDEGWSLACPRELESYIYASNDDPTLWPRFGALAGRTLLIGSDPDQPGAGGPAKVCRAMAAAFDIDYACIPDSSHMLQLERPETCRAEMEAFLAAQGFPS